MAQNPITQLEQQIGHSFKDKALIQMALTHSSVGGPVNYERLEFLGDRVLGLVIAKLLYNRFPDEPEGDMAKRLAALVQGEFLAAIAREMGLGAYINFSEAESLSGGSDNDNILADVFEAMIGALYLDSGFEKCETLIQGLWGERLDIMVKPPQHPKTRLQEWAQSKNLPLPTYEIVAQTGPDHAPIFEIKVSIDGYAAVSASGKSRQVAEKQAAKDFWDALKKDGKA